MKKILVIEDNQEICEVIRRYFSDEGLEITCIQDGDAALEFIGNGLEEYGLVLLDIMLPHTDGFTICKQLRRISEIPVIFITARGREEDVLYGYDLGCDDYIVKPFSLAELHAKCKAMMKRAEGSIRQESLKCGKIELDVRTLRCFSEGKEVELPPKEFALLRYLMEHPDWIVDRDTLLNRIWGYDYFGTDRVVDNHIRLLRKALGPAGKQVKTVFGRGYKLSDK